MSLCYYAPPRPHPDPPLQVPILLNLTELQLFQLADCMQSAEFAEGDVVSSEGFCLGAAGLVNKMRRGWAGRARAKAEQEKQGKRKEAHCALCC